MRKYKGNYLTSVVCNRCGMPIAVEKEIVREGLCRINIEWDYFSEKDGEVHTFDLCEKCYDEITSEFVIPVSVCMKTELL